MTSTTPLDRVPSNVTLAFSHRNACPLAASSSAASLATFLIRPANSDGSQAWTAVKNERSQTSTSARKRTASASTRVSMGHLHQHIPNQLRAERLLDIQVDVQLADLLLAQRRAVGRNDDA